MRRPLQAESPSKTRSLERIGIECIHKSSELEQKEARCKEVVGSDPGGDGKARQARSKNVRSTREASRGVDRAEKAAQDQEALHISLKVP